MDEAKNNMGEKMKKKLYGDSSFFVCLGVVVVGVFLGK